MNCAKVWFVASLGIESISAARVRMPSRLRHVMIKPDSWRYALQRLSQQERYSPKSAGTNYRLIIILYAARRISVNFRGRQLSRVLSGDWLRLESHSWIAVSPTVHCRWAWLCPLTSCLSIHELKQGVTTRGTRLRHNSQCAGRYCSSRYLILTGRVHLIFRYERSVDRFSSEVSWGYPESMGHPHNGLGTKKTKSLHTGRCLPGLAWDHLGRRMCSWVPCKYIVRV